jgi:acetyl-CoA C-acetyltransferase
VPVTDINGLTDAGRDETIRPGTSVEIAGQAQPSFEMMGTMGFDATALDKYTTIEKIQHVHHAGNSSGIVDGAALMLLGSKEGGRQGRASSHAPRCACAPSSAPSPPSC